MKNISSLGSLDYLGYGGMQPSAVQPSFYMPLKNTLVPVRGTGSATFTRATTATLTDFESLLKTAKAGEARFEGARRVENLILNSALNGGTSPTSWIVSSGTNRTSALSNLNDNHSAITFSSAGTREILNQFISCEVGRSYRLVAYCEAVSGNSSDTSMVITSSGGTGSTSAGASVLTSNMVAGKYIVSNIADCTASGTLSFRIGLGTGSTPTGTGSITLSHIQVEDVTGKANQNPSEYVSSGVLSAPYHGAGVDGVKYFTTLNGNTVSGNVVTEATGSAIPEATLKGVMIEVASTNLSVYSQDISVVNWTKFKASASVSGIAPDGTSTMGLLTEDGTLGIHYTYQAKTVTASTVYTYSRYYKYNGRFVRHSYVTGGSVNGCYCDVDLQNGTIVNSGALGSGTFSKATIEALPNGIYRVSLTGSIGTATTGYIVSTVRDVSTNVLTEAGQFYTGNSTSGAYVWGAQFEQLPMATTYIPTTTASVTRNADVLTFPNAGNVSDTQGTVLMTVIPAFDIPNSVVVGYGYSFLVDFGNNNGQIFLHNGGLRREDGTSAVVTPAWTPLKNITYKIGSRYGSVGQRNWLNGTAGTNGAFDGSINSGTNMKIGGYGVSSDYNWGGNIKNVKIYKKVLSDAKITLLTT
jgi:hypothetical protein